MVGLEEHVIQIRVGSESGTSAGCRGHDETPYAVVEEELLLTVRSVALLG